jgi:putative hydrolase of the HAD superfamily
MPVRAIFFDYDGVLTLDTSGSLTTNRFVSERSGIPYDRVANAFRRHNQALNEGASSYAEIWPAVCADLECDLPLDLLMEAFASTPINEPMLELARDLRRRCHVGIITDNKMDRMEYLTRHQRLRDVFDPIIVSAEVGATKTDGRIFQAALRALGVDAVDSLFIDNTASNLIAASAVGIKTVWFDEKTNDVSRLAQRLAVDFGV